MEGGSSPETSIEAKLVVPETKVPVMKGGVSNSRVSDALRTFDFDPLFEGEGGIDVTDPESLREALKTIGEWNVVNGHKGIAEKLRQAKLTLTAMEQKPTQSGLGLSRVALAGAGAAAAVGGIASVVEAASPLAIYADISSDVLEQVQAFQRGANQGSPFSPGPEGIKFDTRQQNNPPPNKEDIIDKMENGINDQVFYGSEDVQAVSEYLDSVGMESNAAKAVNLLVRFSETTIPVDMLIELANRAQESQLPFNEINPALLFVQTYYGNAPREMIDHAMATDQHIRLFDRLASFVGQPGVDLQRYLSLSASNGRLRELGQFGVLISPDMIDPTKVEAETGLLEINVRPLLYYLFHEQQAQPFSPFELNEEVVGQFKVWEENFIGRYYHESIISNNPNKDQARSQYEAAGKQINDYISWLYEQYHSHKRQPIVRPTAQPTKVAPTPTPLGVKPTEELAQSTPTQAPESTEVPQSSDHKGNKTVMGIVSGLLAALGIGGGMNKLKHYLDDRRRRREEETF